MAYDLAVGLNLGAANTGLALEAQLVDSAGANVGAAITTGFVEFGASGNYEWFTAVMPDGHQGGIVFQVSPGGAVKTFVSINPAETETGTVTDIADEVWSHTPRTLTQSAMQIAAAITGSYLSAKRGDTWTIPITGLGDLTSRTKLYFTLKADTEAADAAALVQIEETAGLLFIDGAAGTAGDGDITVQDAANGDITIILEAPASALLDPETYYTCDIQLVEGANVLTVYESRFEVTTDRTRAVT